MYVSKRYSHVLEELDYRRLQLKESQQVSSCKEQEALIYFLVSCLVQAKQLKDYENAVIAKRLEELDEDELQALVEEVDKDDF
mgnify:CR=1 FL=1